MMLVSDCIETVLRLAFGGKFEFPTHHYTTKPDNTTTSSLTVASSKEDEDEQEEEKATCTVTLDVESPPEGSNKWSTRQIPNCKVILKEGDYITVDLGDGAPHFKVHSKHVSFGSSSQSLKSKQKTCTVTIEQEGSPDVWITKTIQNCIVEEEIGQDVVVNFGDGSPGFKIARKHTDLGDTEGAKRTSLLYNIGDVVEVSYEKKSGNDSWEMNQSVGKIVGCTAIAAEIKFNDDRPIYTAPLSTIRPHHPKQSIAVGDVVDVTYEEEAACGTWMNKTETAKVHSIKNSNTVVVDWGDGDSLFCCNTKFVKKSISPNKYGAKSKSCNNISNKPNLVIGSEVFVTYEEEQHPDQWSVKRERATIISITGTRVTVDWGDNDGTYETDIKHVSLVDAEPSSNNDISQTNGHTPEVKLHSKTVPTSLSVGQLVSVEFEEEIDGKWSTTTDTALIREINSEKVVVDWLDKDKWYTTETKFVSNFSPENFKIGQSVIVSYEKEESSGWVSTTDTATVTSEASNDLITVLWSNGMSDSYTCPIQYVAPLSFSQGDSVTVSYEKETTSGSWELSHEAAEVVSVKGDSAVVRWEGADDTYTSPLKFVSST